MRSAALLIALLPGAASAQDAPPRPAPPPPGWSYPPLTVAQPPADALPAVPPGPPPVYVPAPAGPLPTFLPERTVRVDELPPDAAPGQQHWVSLNAGIGQPSAFRLGVKVWQRPQNSVWVEAYWGSALFDVMYGFGVRLQHTALAFGTGDRLMFAPGISIQNLPDWQSYDHARHFGWGYGGGYESHHTSPLWFVVADVDISWLHDFSPRCGFEVGLKLGVAAKVGGDVGAYYPRSLMFGKGAYPLIGVYSGFRF